MCNEFSTTQWVTVLMSFRNDGKHNSVFFKFGTGIKLTNGVSIFALLYFNGNAIRLIMEAHIMTPPVLYRST